MSSKRKAVADIPQASKRVTRSSADKNLAPPLLSDKPTASIPPYLPLKANHTNEAFYVRRDPNPKSTVAVPTLKAIIDSKKSDHSPQDKLRIVGEIREEVKAKIVAAEALLAGQMVDQRAFEVMVNSVSLSKGLGLGRGSRVGSKVPSLRKYVERGTWLMEGTGGGARYRVHLKEEEFDLSATATPADLEALVQNTQRSTTYSNALTSSDPVFRNLSAITARASLAVDHARGQSNWYNLLLLELNKFRKPSHQFDYSGAEEVRLYLFESEKWTVIECVLYQGNRRVMKTKLETSDPGKVDDLIDHFTTLLDLQESGKLDWAKVLEVKRKRREGLPPGVQPSVKNVPDGASLHTSSSRDPLDARLWASVQQATGPRDYRQASDEERHLIVEHVKEHFCDVDIDVTRDPAGNFTITRQAIVLDGVSAEILVALPTASSEENSTARNKEIRNLVAQANGCVSFDHIFQMVWAKPNKTIVPVMNSPLNIMPVSEALNLFFYRWPKAQNVLMFLGVSVAETTNGVVNDNPILLETHRRLIRVSKPAYRAHRMPCERWRRALVPIKRLQHLLDLNSELMRFLGVSFAGPELTSQALIKQTGLTTVEFEEKVSEQYQVIANDYYTQMGEELNSDLFPPVRPGSNLHRSVSEDMIEDISDLSARLELELGGDTYNIRFVKTREGEEGGIIALSSDGSESVEELCQLLLKFDTAALVKYGFQSANPCLTLYANSVCFVAHSILQQRDYLPFETLTKCFFFDPFFPGIPLMIPPDSKHPFLPSICSNDHPHHDHGWNESSPRPQLEDLRFETWDHRVNTQRLGTHCGNLGDGQGPSEWLAQNRQSIRDSVSYLRSTPESGYANLETRFFDLGPEGENFIVDLEDFIQEFDQLRPMAPPASADVKEEYARREDEPDEDEEDVEGDGETEVDDV